MITCAFLVFDIDSRVLLTAGKLISNSPFPGLGKLEGFFSKEINYLKKDDKKNIGNFFLKSFLRLHCFFKKTMMSLDVVRLPKFFWRKLYKQEFFTFIVILVRILHKESIVPHFLLLIKKQIDFF